MEITIKIKVFIPKEIRKNITKKGVEQSLKDLLENEFLFIDCYAVTIKKVEGLK